MKIGDYVRFKTLSREIKIGKVIDIIEPDKESMKKYCVYDLDNNEATVDDYIIKSSPNIIDLIEEGDILKVNDFKDVYTIYEVEIFRNPYTNEKYLGIRHHLDLKPKRLYEIPLVNLSIVTKEQFENCMYKIGEDK